MVNTMTIMVNRTSESLRKVRKSTSRMKASAMEKMTLVSSMVIWLDSRLMDTRPVMLTPAPETPSKCSSVTRANSPSLSIWVPVSRDVFTLALSRSAVPSSVMLRTCRGRPVCSDLSPQYSMFILTCSLSSPSERVSATFTRATGGLALTACPSSRTTMLSSGVSTLVMNSGRISGCSSSVRW